MLTKLAGVIGDLFMQCALIDYTSFWGVAV